MRKRTVVTFEDKSKEFTIKELTLSEIIELVNESTLFVDGEAQDNGVGEPDGKDGKKAQAEPGASGGENPAKESLLLGDVLTFSLGIGKDMQKILAKSCDFTVEDLRPLAPSEIRKIWTAFQSVNSDFLDFLKALGLMEAMLEVREATLSRFSRMLATSLKAAM
jgi:hypothetical protein